MRVIRCFQALSVGEAAVSDVTCASIDPKHVLVFRAMVEMLTVEPPMVIEKSGGSKHCGLNSS
jgi:hypothetical protein